MKREEIKETLKYTGAFIAWVIGSGFATGQEIFQFFASYSYLSLAAVLINLVLFVVLGKTLLTKGFENRDKKEFNHYEFYCGKKAGKLYSIILPFTLLMLISVIISSSGAVMNQYYSINRYLGSLIMAAVVLISYLMGFEKMVKTVSFIGPFIIAFAVFVGVYTTVKDIGSFSEIGKFTNELSSHGAAHDFVLSALLYVSLNFFCGGKYYTELGKTAKSRRSAYLGAVFGAILIVLTILFINLAMLLNAGEIMQLPVPTLYLAKRISRIVGAVFSVALVLGMFTSCATTVWSFCSEFYKNDSKKNKIFALVSVIVSLLMGLLPFSKLVSVLYPLIGYIGIYYIVCVIYRGFGDKNHKIKQKNQSRI